MYNSGRRGKRASDGYGIISQADKFYQTEYPIPIVTSFAVTDGSYVPLDDTAASTAGGQTIVVYGSGFAPGATVMVGGSTIGAVTYLDQGRLTFTSPANSSGSYTIIVINANGGTGILVPGLVYSGVPTWSTSAGSVGSVYETTSVSSTFVATGDAPMTYSVLSGSLPPGTSLSTTGVLSGSAPVESGSTTYSFTIRATDGQLQDSDRSFSLTVNTDVITWSSPTNNQVISSYEYAPISNVTSSATSAAGYGVVYSSNTRPTGISLNAATGVISGTANTVGNTYTRLTATANTTGRTAIRDVVFNVNQDVVTWSTPTADQQYTLSGGSAMSPVSLSATSAAGFGVQYSANALPSGVSLSGSTISGTPDTTQTVYTLLTATANTTNRSATRTISWVISLGDLYWKYTTLALNATPTVTPFHMDLSNNNSTLTITGDTKPSMVNPYQEGYYSTTFSSSNYLTVTSPSIAMGTGDFTIEFWMYFTGTDGTRYDLIDTGTIVLYRYSDNYLHYYYGGTNKISISSFTAAAYGNRWLHFAISRVSGSTKMFINGSQVGSTYADTNSFTISSLLLGYNAGAGTYWPGQVSNFRILAGTGLYSTTFTPPTTPLTAVANTALLLFQSNRIVDKSPRNYAVPVTGTLSISPSHPFANTYQANTQYYSLNFASGQYTSSTITGGLGTGDWTVEGWVYFTTSPGSNNGLFHLGAGSILASNSLGTALAIYNGLWHVYLGNSLGDPSGVGTAPVTNRWYHFAIVRSGTTSKLYIDAVQVYSVADSVYDYSTSVYLALGAYYSSAYAFNGGHISNFRIVRGTALYSGSSTSSANFTLPTGPLTAVANTIFLGAQSSTIVDNSTNNYAITTSGTAIKPVVASPFTPLGYTSNTITTLGSAYFDGSGDFISVPKSTSLEPATNGAWCLETWVYATNSGAGAMRIIAYGNASVASGSDLGYYLSITPGTSINGGFYSGTTQYEIVSASSYAIINTWIHVALTSDGTTMRLFVNGTSVGTPVTVTNIAINAPSSATFRIGNYSSNQYLYGYVSDTRFVKGSALYTNNFVPSFTPSLPVANTQLITVQTNGQANNSQVIDSSIYNNIITRTGNVNQGTFSPYSPTGWSNYFNGSSDYITNSASGTAMTLTGNWTIEFWVNTSQTTRADILSPNYTYTNTGWFMISLGQTNTTSIEYNETGGGAGKILGVLNRDGLWHHIALTKSGTSMRLFVDGTQTGVTYTTTQTQWGASGSGFIIGNQYGSTTYYNGYISNLRVINGTALYTANNTPSTTPLTAVANTALLTCKSNRFVDYSINNSTISLTGTPKVQAFSPFGGTSSTNYYSGYFNGSSDYLTINGSSSLTLSSGDFTIEAWIYLNVSSISTTYAIVSKDWLSGFTYPTYGLAVISGGTVRCTIGSGTESATGAQDINSTSTILPKQWYHIALVKSGSTHNYYFNGVLAGTVTQTGTIGGSTGTVKIGAADNGVYFNGYISNLRIVNKAVYTGNFTPSTTPLLISQSSTTNVASVAIANTQLLTCQSSKFIDNSNNSYSISGGSATVKPWVISPFTPPTPTTGVTYSPTTHGGSAYFDGTGDKLTIASYPTLPLGTSDFTIQCWFHTNAASTEQVIMSNGWASYCPWLLRIDNTNVLRVNMSTSGGAWDIVSEGSLGSVGTNQWYHVAITRSGSTFRGFVNGVQTWTTTSSSSLYNGSQALNIGGRSDTAVPFNGYISGAEIIKGTALYTSNFVPPELASTTSNNTTLLCNFNTGGIVDSHGTTNLESVGDTKLAQESPFEGSYYSNYFDGSGDYLDAGNQTQFAFGTGDFTVECWIYATAASDSAIYEGRANGSGSDGFTLTAYSSSVIRIFSGSALISSSGTTYLNQWTHVAVCRVSGTTTLYINGTSVGTSTGLGNNATGSAVIGGGRYAGGTGVSSVFNGYISNFRIVKGTAVYTSAFTPSTTPLTTISGTSLLTCQSNTFKDNSTNAFTITRNGDAAVKTFNPFKRNTGQSIYFDGTGDYLTTIPSPNLDFGSGDFTVEAWVYPNSLASDWFIASSSATGGFFVGFSSSGTVGFGWGRTATAWDYRVASTATSGSWQHVAVTRSGTSMRLFVNGLQQGTTQTISTAYNLSTTSMTVGSQGAGYYLNGYIRDLRITKGYARYTSNTSITSTFEVK